ncbi:MAG: hypothetical protein GY880_08905 [Planctomycetaceae bacterium]|nr:hypothetical protein [Planctomycetaceae bacterium]MCP4478950.1 hypothetical protein [Planctomycetaceae bacterium]MCP4774343.1 hypothetical protein [Planctomycetaceae bacterium]
MMKDSNKPDDKEVLNPYAVASDFDAKVEEKKVPPKNVNIIVKLFAWFCLILSSILLAAIAFFVTCVGVLIAGSGVSSQLLLLICCGAGLLSMFAALLVGGKGLIAWFTPKQ